ncbi:unnamed protein product [Musa hybrid cultivar]
MAGLVSAHVNPVCQSYNICRSPLVRSTFLQIPEMAIKHPVAVMKHLKPLSVVASSLQPPKSISTAQFSNTIPSEEVLNFWRSVDAVCFDVDSTVCLDEGIDELADFCGAGKAVAEWTTKAMSGSVPFEEALAARLSLFNPSLSQVKDFLEKRPPRISPGIAELTKKLMAQNTDVYLISGGFRQMINPVALQLGIPLENIFANQLLFGSSGEFVGFDSKEPTSRSGGKATAVQQIRKVHDYKALVMIGDGATDLETTLDAEVAMSRPSMTPQKRAQPDSQSQPPALPENERILYELIKSRKNMGIWTADMKKETGLQNIVVTKALKSLQNKNLIKDVVNVHNKARKIFMAVEFEPSKEVSGGSWYSEGSLDTEFINILRKMCLKHIEELKVATIEDIWKSISASGVLKVACTMQQVLEIVRALALDKEIEELKSTGVGEFSTVQTGKVCYRSLRGREAPRVGHLSSIPCGVCPRISECTPDGVISPKTCVYYNKWLKLEF